MERKIKKPIILFIITVVIAVVVIALWHNQTSKGTPKTQVTQYLKENYPNMKVEKIQKYKEEGKRCYFYPTDDDREITFTVTMEDEDITDDLVENINIYIARRYAGTDVTGWSHDKSFRARFFSWVERQKVCGVSDNTVHKYETDFKRFFEPYLIGQALITAITTEEIENHFATIIEKTKAPKRSIKCAFGYVNGVFEKCLREGYIDKNPCALVDLRLMLTHCSKERTRKEQNRWVTAEEMKQFLHVLKRHMEENPSYIQNYAVFFSVYTGLRVGEISALRWKDIDFHNQYAYIHSSQKFNSLTKEFYNGDTKTHQNRMVPLVDNALSLLVALKQIQEENGIKSEFVFANQEGQITAKAISECVRRRCHTAGIPEKSIHSIRRTLNSNMRGSGTPVAIASSIMGHSEEVNIEHYTNDLSSINFVENGCKRPVITNYESLITL